MRYINTKGFSLVSVMIAAGMMGGLALGVMKFMQDSSKSSTTLMANVEVNDLHQKVLLFLSNPLNCKATFSGRHFGDDEIPLARSADSIGTPDQNFNGLSGTDSKVKLTDIKIYHPVNETAPASADLELPAQEPELDGWWSIVEFKYDKYKTVAGQKAKIFGGTQVKRFSLMKFDNFDVSNWVDNKDICSTIPYTLAGDGKEYVVVGSGGEETIWLGPCMNGNPALPILSCAE